MSNKRVAICGVNSHGYLAALLDVWQKGNVAVLCPTRDPAGITQTWLGSINCERVIHADHYSHRDSFQVGDFPGSAGTILRTSGSSSKPKSVLHSLDQHLANARGVVSHLSFDASSRWLLSLPLYHVGGLGIFVRALVSGASVRVPTADQSVEQCIREGSATHVSLVATQLARLMRKPDNLPALRKLKAIVLGGGPAPRALIAHAIQENLSLVTSYGSTEMASQITATRLGDSAQGLLSSGSPLPGRELHIAPGGEICVKGPMLFSGYLDGEDLRSARDEAGWFHTGDRGTLDEHGQLHVQGRLDNMMISGGENIHPEEIEAALLEHPQVEMAMVVPVSHIDFGQRPAAFVKTYDDSPHSSDALRGHLAEHLAKFKIPTHFLPWPSDVPMHGIKVSRAWFKERAEAKITPISS
jgi:O-succinylbenzoic acid--CoA ligase